MMNKNKKTASMSNSFPAGSQATAIGMQRKGSVMGTVSHSHIFMTTDFKSRYLPTKQDVSLAPPVLEK